MTSTGYIPPVESRETVHIKKKKNALAVFRVLNDLLGAFRAGHVALAGHHAPYLLNQQAAKSQVTHLTRGFKPRNRHYCRANSAVEDVTASWAN